MIIKSIACFIAILLNSSALCLAQIKWESLNAPKSSGVGDIAHTSNNDLYALTSHWGDVDYVYALYRSVDDGTSWEKVTTITDAHYPDLVIDSKDRIFINTRDLLYISDDFGKTWTTTRTGVQYCWSFDVAPSGYLFAAGTTDVTVSRDGGTTWEVMNPPYDTDGIDGIAADYNGDFYVCNNDYELLRTSNLGFSWYPVYTYHWDKCYEVYRGKGGIYIEGGSDFYRTTDRTATWEKVDAPSYFMENVVMNSSGGIVFWGDWYYSENIFASMDAGASWSKLPPFPIEGVYLYCLDIDAHARVLAGTNAGLFTLQPDSTWERTFIDQGEPERVYRVLSVAPDKVVVSFDGGLYDYNPENGTWAQSQMPIAIDEYIGNVVEGKNGMTVIGASSHLVRTSDGGATWELGTIAGGAQHMHSLITDSEHNLYAEAFNQDYDIILVFGFYKSTDNGSTWEKTEIRSVDYSIYMDSQHRWYQFDYFNNILASSDYGASWITHTVDFYPEWMFIGPQDQLMVISFDTLYYSSDIGASWQAVYAPFATNIYDMVWSPDGTVFAALSYYEDESGIPCGMMASTDGGFTWQKASEGMKQADCRDLELHADGRLYAATTAGLFRTTAPLSNHPQGSVSPSAFSLSPAYPNPVTAGEAATVEYALSQPGEVSVKVYNILGVEVYSSQTGRQTPGAHTLSIPTRGLAPGVYRCVMYANNAYEMRMLIVR